MEIEKINRKQIIEELKANGYQGKKITYQEFLLLYKKYGIGMSESFFGIHILDITSTNFGGQVYAKWTEGKKKVVILNKYVEEIPYEKIEIIIHTLINNGYSNTKITYKEFQSLHLEYGQGISEKDFALKILGISYSNYHTLKSDRSNKSRVRILKPPKIELELEDISKIIHTLKENGYTDTIITYEELQSLHLEYGQGISEKDFALKVLGISDSNYSKRTTFGKKFKILRPQKNELTELDVQRIRNLLSEKGYTGKRITYKELQELYKQYGSGISERKFAHSVLRISDRTYYESKKQGKEIEILQQSQREFTDLEIQQIKQLLFEKGYAGRKITYEKLQELHKKYGQGMSEKDFSLNVLGITLHSYNSCKNYGDKSIILKSPKINPTRIWLIIQRLKEKGYINKKITYEELHELYLEYGNGMTEINFAQQILGISYKKYCKCKENRIEIKILGLPEQEISLDKIEQIIQLLREKGYTGRKITYQELQELHKTYGNKTSEKFFALYVLGIPLANYYAIKRGAKITILSANEISIIEVEKIIQVLQKKGYTGKKITYKELQELHKEFGNQMNEADFALNILGLTHSNYSNSKFRKL